MIRFLIYTHTHIYVYIYMYIHTIEKFAVVLLASPKLTIYAY